MELSKLFENGHPNLSLNWLCVPLKLARLTLYCWTRPVRLRWSGFSEQIPSLAFEVGYST